MRHISEVVNDLVLAASENPEFKRQWDEYIAAAINFKSGISPIEKFVKAEEVLRFCLTQETEGVA